MTVQEALDYFGTNKSGLAKILKVARGNISYWGDKIPELHAYRLHDLTFGGLKADRKDYPF